MEQNNQWFVAYTRSRQEKILAEQLAEAGYTVYLPLIKKISHWSDRKKVTEVPLFKSYVFIKGVNQKVQLKDFRPFVGFLQYDGKPAIVKQKEIDTLKSIISYGYDISEADDISKFQKGCMVQVIGGPLKGVTGELISVEDEDRFLLSFENMGTCVQIKIPPKAIRKIDL